MSPPVRLLSLVLLALAACTSPPGEDTPDGGGEPPPDLCDTREEALSLADCQLTLGTEVTRYISKPGDQDWYSVQLPSTVGPRTLVRVTAGYRASSTAVNLSVGLMGEDGSPMGSKVDAHGQGAPQPVEMLVPYKGAAGGKLLLLVNDSPTVPTRPGFDARNTYFLKVEVVDNPDTHEPNDKPEQATAVPLTAQGGLSAGSSTGYIATAGDVDFFSFDVPAGKVLYVHLTGPRLEPAPAYRLSYTLRRPDGTADVEGSMRPKVVPADLATARRVTAAGKWVVEVKGYRASTDTEPPPGDLRQEYRLDVKVMDEEDAQDKTTPNDEYEKAFARDLGSVPGAAAKTTFIGRLGTVADKDWYVVTVGSSNEPTVLRYGLRSVGTTARFEPIPGLVDRQVRVLTPVVMGTTVAEQEYNCVNLPEACPKGYGENRGGQGLVNAFCANKPSPPRQPPLCLYSSREEESQGFANLSNFQGAIPVPPNGTTRKYYFLVQDDGSDWAEDRDYELTVSWDTDADEKTRFAGNTTEQTVQAALNEDTTREFFPAPPPGAGYEVSGELTHGYGRLRTEARVTGYGVRGPNDYDAVPSDVDTFEFQLPAGTTAVDRTWELQWSVNHLPDGGVPHQLALDVTFCDGDRTDGGVCTPVSVGSRNVPLTLAYRPDPLRAWHSEGSTLSGLQPHYGLSTAGNATTVTVLPYACSCLEPRFVKGGKLWVAVTAAERTGYEPVRYTLRTAFTDYPQRYSTDGGAQVECPRPDGGTVEPDGGTSPVRGCFYTRQP
ncbi:cell-cell cohesion protein MtsF [Myxococcaceae bacterium GXIMD 01537]